MTASLSTARGRAGLSLVSLGVLLLLIAMMTFAVPGGTAFADVGGDSFPTGDCGVNADGGYKIQWNIDAVPPTFTFDQAAGVAQGDIVFGTAYSPGPPNNTLVWDFPDAESTGYYLDFTYTNNSGYDLVSVFFKTGGGDFDEFVSPVANPGTLELPKKLSHVTFCFETSTTTTTTTTTTLPPTTTTTTTTLPPTTTTTTSTTTTTTTTTSTTTTTLPPTTTTTTTTLPPTTTTTTTTLPPTTTTTIGGPTTTTSTTTTTIPGTTTTTIGGPTTTTTTLGSTTTTTLGGPCDPTDPECLPNTGGGNLLSVLLAGLGMLFVGVGLLAMADERRRVLAR